jgi:hypothetical protein
MVVAALVLLMAITQPLGAGTTIFFNDDSDAAGGHAAGSPHTFTEIAAAFPADFNDLGTTPRSYRSRVTLTNGETTGLSTLTTTLTESDCFIVFDATRTYSVQTAGRANRFTNFGILVDGTRDSARQGVSAVFGTATTIQGNATLYGCKFKSQVGAITLSPGTTGLSYQIINCIVESIAQAVSLGVAATGNVNIVYNVDVTGGSVAAGAIANFGADSAERITVSLNPAGTYHFRTNSIFSAKDVVLIGIGPGTGAQLRVGGAGTTLISPTWDQGLAIVDGTHSANVDEYWPYGVVVLDGSSNPVAGLTFTLVNGLGATVVNTTTNASGGVSFGSGLTANCVNVVSYPGGTTKTYKGPFTARINQGAVNPSYPQLTTVFNWPSTATWGSGNVQYQDMFAIVQLIPPGGLPTGWIERIVPTII